MIATPRCLTIVALALALTVLPPPSLAAAAEPEAPLPSALAEDDECLAGDERCSLNALQLRGQTLEAGSARATMHSTLQGLFSDLGRMVEGADETCQEAGQALMGCLPQSITQGGQSKTPPTTEDVTQLCSCENHVEAMLACPAPSKQLAQQLLPMLKAMCSECGLAAAEASLNPQCTVKAADGNVTLDAAAACGSQCHPLVCGMLKACPAGYTVEGLPPKATASIAQATASAAEMVKSCACSA